MHDEVVRLTQQLVRIPSVNPMGRSLAGPEFLEGRVTDFLQDWATRLGLNWERHSVLPGRDNLVVRLDGCGEAIDRLIMLEVHQDTVPTDGMTIAPFDAELKEGRIYGRGACDVKGGMAAMLVTVARLLREPAASQPTVVLALTVNEENGFDGIRHLCETWKRGESRLIPRSPDLAIVAEPTELNVVVAHKGAVRWRCHSTGRAVHSSDPSAGVNAIYRMQPVLVALQRYADLVLAPSTSDPLLGRPTLSVGTIQGGVSVNTVPDRCSIEIDRRLLPGESADRAYGDVVQYLSVQLAADVVPLHDPPFLRSPGLPAGPNRRLADCMAACSTRCDGPGRQIGVPFGTDAGALAEAGVPTVVFGPGSIRQAHTRDEWIECQHLRRAVEILTHFCRDEAWPLLAH